MDQKLASLKDNEAELKKCQESPLYFFNTYILKEGEQPLTQNQFDKIVQETKVLRDRVPACLRYRFIEPKRSCNTVIFDSEWVV